MSKIYETIILGAGPAGLAAGLYAGRSRIDTLLIEKGKDGGQIVITSEIDNYPGSIEHETGPSLVQRMTKQVEKFDVERVTDNISSVDFSGEIKKLTGSKGEYLAKTVIIATGAMPRPIGCPGEREYLGKGVSYCATCDGAFFEDLEIFVVGGGDSAIEEAIYLTKFGRKVTVIHRRNALRAAKSIQERAFKNEKMAFMWDSVVVEVKGEDGILTSFVVKNVKTDELTEVHCDEEDGTFGLFVFVGFIPFTQLFEGQVEMESGYIVADENMKTSVPGVFVAGDCRVKSLRQVVTAAADGAIAATQVEKYLEELSHN